MTNFSHMVQAIHTTVEGRARFKIEGLYRCEPLKKFLEQKFTHPNGNGIISFSANIYTGNALVQYHTDTIPESIRMLLDSYLKEYNQVTGIESEPDSQKGPGKSTRKRQAPKPHPKTVKLDLVYQDQVSKPWHMLEKTAVLAGWSISPDKGLTREVVQQNFKTFGPNAFPETLMRSQWEIFLGQFTSLPVALLGGAAGLSIVTGGVLDAVLILGVVVGNAILAYKTESAAETTIQSLKNLVKPTAQVIREGELQEISIEEVVPGDILDLKPGTFVAADCRLLETDRLSVDEAALTGESLPVIKSSGPLELENIPLGDRVNMVYRGTMVTGGQGRAVVIATGPFTELGKLQALVEEAETPETPLEKQLDRVGNELILLGCGVCGLVGGVGILRGFALLNMAHMAISLAAAAVPEGLPTVATTTLAMGVKNMEKHKVLIRRLEAVETLGCLQTICMDKTGTITRNEMTVVKIFAGMNEINLDLESSKTSLDLLNLPQEHEIPQLLKIGTLCNETEIDLEGGSLKLSGSATEKALVQLAVDQGVDVIELREQHPLSHVSHRSEQRPFMTTFHKTPGGETLLALKGSPLDVLAMCEWHLKDGRKLRLNVKDRLNIEMGNDRMAGDSLRVLGVAYYSGNINGDIFEERVNHIEKGFTWLGIAGMADPIREGVREMIADFHRAGIQTVMITGDQSATAYAIGKELNLSQGQPLEILDATHLENMDAETLKALAQRVHVFARVSPANKLEIVRALQSAGLVVGMTGDGINDGPALKAAEVGIAMGQSGTDVAREVADVVLKEDNMGDLVIAIKDGRTTYSNIKKAVHFFLSSNVSEIAVMFVALAGGIGSPLNTMQLLWINLISDIFPGLALTQEAPEPDVLRHPPRSTDEPVFTPAEYWRIGQEGALLSAGSLGAYSYGLSRYGKGPKAGTLAFNTLVFAQLLHTLSCRSDHETSFSGTLPSNPMLNLAVGGSIVVQLLTMLIPGLRSILGMTTLGLADMAVVAGTSILPLLVNEATKKKAAAANNRKF